MKDINKVINKYRKFLNWYNMVLYFLIVRLATDISYGLIYGFILVLFLLRIKLEKIPLIFLSIAVVIYALGKPVEANHYISFVYAFLGLLFLKYFFQLIRREE